MSHGVEGQAAASREIAPQIDPLHAGSAVRDTDADTPWRALVAAAPDHISICSRDGTIRFLNHPPPGVDLAQILGRNVFDFILPEFHGVARAAYDTVVAHGGTVPYEVPVRTTSPGLHWFACRVSRLERSDGAHELIVIGRDVTARRSVEERAARLAHELEQRVDERTRDLMRANRELESFSYSVSHDLRAPLRAMNAWASILLEDHETSFDAEERDMLERIRRNAVRMGALIDEVLTFSELARRPLAKVPLELQPIVRDVWNDLAQSRAGRDVELRIAALPAVEGEPSLVHQALWHLVSNALKYTRPRAQALIEIGCRSTADEHVLFVRDNGVGFEPAFAHKLFGVFQRLHREDEFEGLGIGLALVQRIALRHGGRAWAEGAPDRGATIHLSFPR